MATISITREYKAMLTKKEVKEFLASKPTPISKTKLPKSVITDISKFKF